MSGKNKLKRERRMAAVVSPPCWSHQWKLGKTEQVFYQDSPQFNWPQPEINASLLCPNMSQQLNLHSFNLVLFFCFVVCLFTCFLLLLL